jgi:hypothetical protein
MNIFELEDEINRLMEQFGTLKQPIRKLIKQRKKKYPFYCHVCRKDFQTLETYFEIEDSPVSERYIKEIRIICPLCNRLLYSHSYTYHPNTVELTSEQLENISKIIPQIYEWCEPSIPRPTPYIISIFNKKRFSKYYSRVWYV